MRRSRAVISGAVALIALVVVIALVLSGGGDDPGTTTTPAPAAAPSGGATPPSDPGQLPPGFVECMADQGFEVESPEDIHSAPPEVLQTCFGASHPGGG